MSRDDAVLRILDTALRSAADGEPLPPALRAEGGRLAQLVADRLEQGQDLGTALGHAIDDDLRVMLATARPPLHETALLASEWLRRRGERRSTLLQAILHPLATLGIIATTLVLARDHLDLDLAFMPLLGLALPLALLPALVALPPSGPLSWCSWRGPLRRAAAWERAGLIHRHRLSDAQAEPFVGPDWATIRPFLSSRDAEKHCRRMATLDAGRARWRLRLLTLAAVVGITLISGAVLLHAAKSTYVRFLDRIAVLAEMEPVSTIDVPVEALTNESMP